MEQKIVFLRGPDRIRRRPAVMFNSDGLEGVQTMVNQLLDILAEEARTGYSSKLTISLYADGAIGLQDNGRGIYFGDDDTIWHALFCEFYPAGPYTILQRRNIFQPTNPQDADNLELYSAQCASAYMDICVHRDDWQYRLHFEKGFNIGGLDKQSCAAASGTYIRFRPDPEVFTDTALPASWLSQRAQELSDQLPGVSILFQDERNA